MGAHPGQTGPGEWLRQQRLAAGLTQEDLAERSGVSVRAIADLERGRTRKPYPSSVRSLVRALGLPEETGTDLVARYRAGDGAGPANLGPASPGQDGDGPSGADGDEAGGVAVPRQLPTRVPNFAGRAEELALLDGVLDAAASSTPSSSASSSARPAKFGTRVGSCRGTATPPASSPSAPEGPSPSWPGLAGPRLAGPAPSPARYRATRSVPVSSGSPSARTSDRTDDG